MKQLSIAEARNGLPTLVKTVESGGSIEITKRGRGVAVVVPIQEYQRLLGQTGSSFLEALELFRAEVTENNAFKAGDFDNLRDRDLGREIIL
ncbi:MAG: type II toxin-antitoxin system Phd/YefM family antitoxin [Myxococcaceae bacterium]